MNIPTSYDGLWKRRLHALSAAWPDFLAGEAAALHKTRVASRRIREALPVVGVSASPTKVKKLRRRMRELTQFLGPIRELDVQLAMIEKEAAAQGVPRSALALVRREVAAERHALRKRLKNDRPVSDLKKLLKKLERIAHVKAHGRRDTGDKPVAAKGRAHGTRTETQPKHEIAWRAALAASLIRRAKKLKAALEEAGPLYAPERIHGVRIAIKKLRYALEISEEAGYGAVRPMLKMLKREQERLGRLHDLQRLLQHVRDAEASPRSASRLGELTAYADTLERDCRRLHAEFVASRDDLFQCVQEVRRELVPALARGHVQPARAAVRVRTMRVASAERRRR